MTLHQRKRKLQWVLAAFGRANRILDGIEARLDRRYGYKADDYEGF